MTNERDFTSSELYWIQSAIKELNTLTTRERLVSECPLTQCHLRRDEIYDEDLFKHLRLYHSKEDLAKYIFDLNNNQHNITAATAATKESLK